MRHLGIDHVVFTVSDVEASLAWYVDELGMEAERVDEWRDGDAPFPSVRASDTFIIDLFAGEPDGTNVDHIALVVADDVDEIADSGRFEVVDGPGARWGAQGIGRSVYVKDPDGNTVELRNYPS